MQPASGINNAAFKEHIAALKAACPATDIAAALGLKGRGKRFFCPACQSDGAVHKTPDLEVFRDGVMCYKCGARGDVIDLLALTGMTKSEAIRFLEDRTGLPRPGRIANGGRGAGVPSGSDSPAVAPKPHPIAPPAVETRLDHSDLFAFFLERICRPVVGTPGDVYLEGRGIPAKTASDFGVRFCPDLSPLWELAGRGAIKSSGLAALYCLQKAEVPFLVFPYARRGRPVCIKARCLLSKAEIDLIEVPRFLNTGGSVPCLWNHDTIAEMPRIIVSEGEIDALSWIIMGWTAVGLPGWAHWKDFWIQDFVGKEVTLCMDCDAAGEKGAADIAGRFQRSGLPIPRTLSMPPGIKDANDYLLQVFTKRADMVHELKMNIRPNS